MNVNLFGLEPQIHTFQVIKSIFLNFIISQSIWYEFSWTNNDSCYNFLKSHKISIESWSEIKGDQINLVKMSYEVDHFNMENIHISKSF